MNLCVDLNISDLRVVCARGSHLNFAASRMGAIACHGNPWPVVACHGKPWHAMACHCMTLWNAMACHGMPWNAMACYGMPWLKPLRISKSNLSGSTCAQGHPAPNGCIISESVADPPLGTKHAKTRPPAGPLIQHRIATPCGVWRVRRTSRIASIAD